MKPCGYSEEGKAVEGLSAGTIHNLIHALKKITQVAVWVSGWWEPVVPQAKEIGSLRTGGREEELRLRFIGRSVYWSPRNKRGEKA